ncbi:hypothetical protein [Zavarzinella formosa]|uniref:hypothetical protein n=1 Tax=Zavarzinella formosa TaxID=360055 RepID=UPI0012FB37A2|nr:hypothetical protein [Zavarzinella formosa]
MAKIKQDLIAFAEILRDFKEGMSPGEADVNFRKIVTILAATKKSEEFGCLKNEIHKIGDAIYLSAVGLPLAVRTNDPRLYKISSTISYIVKQIHALKII